ncbi:RES family NAD+ phosphorylase [Streptomyces sp. LRE541]|uniref:RES family NAD+ phosphorylase n=1 Tax=Streptomyces sp. LRE541 TaxID=2931983 RepID=UPI00200E09A2|nr:RES family NAD+ phosphorylase [Streptomyces sp. LRE541]UPZ29646.1 RES family NAD+ phosphorylase [Streptomyces sp. LRE541]
MTRQLPPEVAMAPRTTVLPAGTPLWRCHRSDYPATAFKKVEAHTLFGGSRFDCTADDSYPYLYATLEPTTALAEVLLRSMDFDPVLGSRIVPWAQASRYTLTRVVTTAELTLVSLRAEEDLAAVCQDSWLLDSEPDDYPRTRYWAQELRRQAKDAQGLLWQSRRHRPREAVVLFGDRCGDEPLTSGTASAPVSASASASASDKANTADTADTADTAVDTTAAYDLSTPAGRDEANRLLAPLRAVIMPPQDREPGPRD